MTQDALFVEERKMKILEFIEENKKATVAQLCDRFKVSSATIRNDLKTLENAKLLIRTHGGAMVNTKTGLELNSHQKQVQNLEAKRRIAERAIDLIEDGDTIILDTGTTTLELARLVEKRKDITVVTNDLVIALLLEESSSANVMFMGGLLRRRFHCTITSGHAWDPVLSGLTVDKAFMGVNSLSIDKGATTPDIHQAETKREMISIAVKVILLCDSSKIERNSFAQFADLERIDTVITEKIRENEKKKFEDRGIEIIVAG